MGLVLFLALEALHTHPTHIFLELMERREALRKQSINNTWPFLAPNCPRTSADDTPSSEMYLESDFLSHLLWLLSSSVASAGVTPRAAAASCELRSPGSRPVSPPLTTWATPEKFLHLSPQLWVLITYLCAVAGMAGGGHNAPDRTDVGLLRAPLSLEKPPEHLGLSDPHLKDVNALKLA